MGETDDFEWDDNKDAANRAKHGLPLPLSALLFDGRLRLDRPSRAGRPLRDHRGLLLHATPHPASSVVAMRMQTGSPVALAMYICRSASWSKSASLSCARVCMPTPIAAPT